MVFEYIDQQHAGFRDVKKRVKKNREIQEMVVLPKNGKTTDQGTLILTEDGVQKPVLGRYQIEKEIGRGAMGLVYLGRDPKIGRTVAIKTMALAQEFDPDELDDIKQRFLREAETAGRLNHQNIVTIYDVGEEQELAYIAMDYLNGHDLARHKQPDKLLPVEVVLDIGIQVATALDFAHKHDVVHRDIKPANIVYDESKPIALPFRSVDISKADRVLGFKPRVSLEQGLTETVGWYKTQLESHVVSIQDLGCHYLPRGR